MNSTGRFARAVLCLSTLVVGCANDERFVTASTAKLRLAALARNATPAESLRTAGIWVGRCIENDHPETVIPAVLILAQGGGATKFDILIPAMGITEPRKIYELDAATLRDLAGRKKDDIFEMLRTGTVHASKSSDGALTFSERLIGGSAVIFAQDGTHADAPLHCAFSIDKTGRNAAQNQASDAPFLRLLGR